MDNCLFCKIVKGEISSQKVYEDEDVLAFKDIHPAAPVHILVIPKKHISCLTSMQKGDEELIAKIFVAINKIAEEQGFKEQGFRVINNCGLNGGQEVMHIHFHVLGGKQLGPKIVK